MMNEEREPLITIIVPIYNVDMYLEECLESLKNQSVVAHRVIMVNDGSTDRSGEIARMYASENPRIFTYLEQLNKGLGAARNIGVEKVETKYFIFLDSDDWLPSCAIENIIRKLEFVQEEPDIGFMTPIVYDMATQKYLEWSDTELLNRIFENENVVSPKEKKDMYALEASVCRNLWNTRFWKENNLAFPEGLKWEDVPIHFKAYHEARRCIKIDGAGFFYRINSGKQITSSAGINRLDVINIFSKTFYLAFDEKWSIDELMYIFKMFQDFVKWSICVSRPVVREKLVNELHSFYKVLPREIYMRYVKVFNPTINMRMQWYILRSGILCQIYKKRYQTKNVKRYYAKLRGVLR